MLLYVKSRHVQAFGFYQLKPHVWQKQVFTEQAATQTWKQQTNDDHKQKTYRKQTHNRPMRAWIRDVDPGYSIRRPKL